MVKIIKTKDEITAFRFVFLRKTIHLNLKNFSAS